MTVKWFNLVLNSVINFEIVTFYFSELNDLLDEHYAKNGEVRKFQFLSASNVILCINQRFAVKNSGISCLTSMLNLSKPKMKMQHAKNGFRFARNDNWCMLTYSSVIKAKSCRQCRESGLNWRCGFNSSRVLKLPYSQVRVALSPSVDWHALLPGSNNDCVALELFVRAWIVEIWLESTEKMNASIEMFLTKVAYSFATCFLPLFTLRLLPCLSLQRQSRPSSSLATSRCSTMSSKGSLKDKKTLCCW